MWWFMPIALQSSYVCTPFTADLCLSCLLLHRLGAVLPERTNHLQVMLVVVLSETGFFSGVES